jgi:cytochrome c
MKNLKKVAFATIMFALWIALGVSCDTAEEEVRVLVFSKTAGYRHESIGAGIEAIRKLGAKQGFAVDTTENATQFNEENLVRYRAVIFLNTTGDIFNQEQQNDFERFIQAGGGFIGIHAATDTEYNWPWYGKLVGAYFESHPNNPNVKKGEYFVVDKNHPASDSLPERFERSDEFYSFKNINPEVKVLVKIDEKTYTGGTNGDNHPMAWYHEYDGGRAFYTGMGHTDETFSEQLFLQHLAGGIEYVLGDNRPVKLNYTQVRTKRVPEENRFTKIVLDEKLDEPVELAVLPGQRVLFVERKGAVKIYDPALKQTKTIANIPVSTKYKFRDNGRAEAEDGLLGVALDPQYEKNNWIYLYYSQAGEKPVNILTRYELKGDSLIEPSKKILLEVDVQREQCCHTGGSIAFDGNGNLFLSTGDNTSPRSTRYAPMDNRPGRSPWDAQKSSANTNDLRGKILRIHPEPDGTYTIPEGNLFRKGTAKTRPEIYIMGGRNPYRISVDKKTGYLYWGDVGPDASSDSVNRGPRAFDEVNQARKAGNFGWPHFVGDNKAYHQRNFATGEAGPAFDPSKPLNNSPNNTGLIELPPAQKAFIWYPYDLSPEFPLLGTGGRTAMAGQVYHTSEFKNAARAFPDYYDGKLFIYEWMRGWIMAVTMDEDGNYVSMERFMPSHKFSNPMDMEFANDGDLYMLEYGSGWFTGNDDARLVRIEYNGNNRKPLVHMAADKIKGAVPLVVNLNSNGTKDYDRDALTYEWKITTKDGKTLTSVSQANTNYTFDQPGVYKAVLTVTDAKGESSGGEIELLAGNEPAEISFDITKGNQTYFFPNQSFEYEVKVNDKEDGGLAVGGISSEQVSVKIDYLPEGFDKVEIAQGHLSADAFAQFATGKKLMEDSDCKACHVIDRKSIGPMYLDVVKKYKDDPKAIDYLAKKIISGGSGVWGEVAMSAHPQMAQQDATEIAKYILSLGDKKVVTSLPPTGSYTMTLAKDESDKGVLIIRAAYTDKGANGIQPATSEKVVMLKSPNFPASIADKEEGIRRFRIQNRGLEYMTGTHNNAHVGYNHIDLSGINQVMCTVFAPVARLNAAGGAIEVRIDSPDGPVIGSSKTFEPVKSEGPIPQPIMVPIKLQPTSGYHDVYFIYKNEKAAEGQSLFILVNIQFHADSKVGNAITMKE